MCGRYALGLQRANLRALPGHQHLQPAEWVDEEAFVPRFNIAPNTHAPVLRRQSNPSESSETDTVLHTMQWGISYGKTGSKGAQAINARSENIVEGSSMWNKLRGKYRCVVPCQGYYEWKVKGKDRIPHFTKVKGRDITLLAGLYERVERGKVVYASLHPTSILSLDDGETSWTFVIVTTDACKELSWLHDRQPVILTSEGAIKQWLDTSSQKWSSDLDKLLKPYDQKHPLQCYQVPKEVGKVGTESPKFIEPVADRKDGIAAMFQKQRVKQEIKEQSSPIKNSEKRKRESPARDEADKTPSKKIKTE